MVAFCLLVKFHRGGSAVNGATPSSFYNTNEFSIIWHNYVEELKVSYCFGHIPCSTYSEFVV